MTSMAEIMKYARFFNEDYEQSTFKHDPFKRKSIFPSLHMK